MTLGLYALGAVGTVGLTASLHRVTTRLTLSKAKHPSLRGHAKMSRFFAKLVPFYEYDDKLFFRSDGAPDEVAERRREGFLRLAEIYKTRYAETVKLTREVESGLSDLQFTASYRVPFQYSRFVRKNLAAGAFVASSAGVQVTDLDGNEAYDLTGAYGVNVFGYDFYRQCLDRAFERARALGPVLGPYHPVVADNVKRLCEISGLDEVSFHMSGTEAVMQAVRLARYHTRRSHLVRFCGAYHGWWGDVQPGVGNPTPARETYTLKDMDDDSLRVLRSRNDIACVLVNPLQALHPNGNAPSDSTLLASDRVAGFDREALRCLAQEAAHRLQRAGHRADLRRGLRRLPPRAARRAGVLRREGRLVTYGKTLGGGLPIGVLCGRKNLMKRFRDDRPADICFARGTFNSHPYVMAAMNEFLHRLETPEVARHLPRTWTTPGTGAPSGSTAASPAKACPVRVANLSTIWTVLYTQPCRYNWMLQYLSACRGAGALVGRDGALHLQPQLQRRRLRRRGRQVHGRRAGHAARTASGGRTRR